MAKAALLAIVTGRLFYDSNLAVLLVMPLTLPLIKKDFATLKKNATDTLGLEFRDAMVSVTTALKAGYSVENAFLSALSDMRTLHGKDAMICKELTRIARGLANNLVLEDLIRDLGARTGQEDIREFASVFAIAKRSGGNLTQIMADTIDLIGDKLDTEKEIRVLLSAKRLESTLMEVIPFFIIAYVSMTNRGFFAPLYHNIGGILMMSAALAIYLGAYFMTEKIVSIPV